MPPPELVIPDLMSSPSQETLCQQAIQESNFIGLQIYQLYHQYLDVIRISPRYVSGLMEHQYHERVKDYWQQFIVKSKPQGTDHLGEIHKGEANRVRSMPQKRLVCNILNQSMFPEKTEQPVIFQERVSREDETDVGQEESSQVYKGIHLFVLVHGFQGNSHDMK